MAESRPRRQWLERCLEQVRPYYLRGLYFRLHPERRPPEFSRCWTVPHEFQGDPPRLDIPPPQPGLSDVLILPMTDWHHRLQRSQHLALALARQGRRCFLLNPHLGREYPQSPWRRRPPALAKLGDRVFEIHAPLRAEPVFHHRLLAPSESLAVADAVDWALERARVDQLDILFALPTWKDCALELRRRRQALLAYDCHDWLAGFPNMARVIADAEPECMAVSDLVLFCSTGLRELYESRLPWIRTRAHFVGNGIPDWPEPPKSRPQSPVVGYVGALETWFWTEAVREAARRLPGAQFVLAGDPCASVRASLAGLPNVTLRGEIPAGEVPAFLAGCRVGLIPRTSALSRYMAPIKVFRVFLVRPAGGLRKDAELDRFGPLVYQTSAPDEFARAVEAALAENDPAREEARRAEARAATWRRRAEELHELLAETRRRLGRRVS